MATLDLGNVMGPQGPQGEQGEVGPQGPQGPQGEQGPPVDTSALMPKTGGSFTGAVSFTDANVSGTLNEVPLSNYLRKEHDGLKESSDGSNALDDIANGFGFCYIDASSGSGVTGPYLSLSGMPSGSYRLQLHSDYIRNRITYRTRNGDAPETWNPWNRFVTEGLDAEITAKYGFTSESYPQIYGNGAMLHLAPQNSAQTGAVITPETLRPAIDSGQPGQADLGTAWTRWRSVYATTGTIQTSDRNAKRDIAGLDPEKMTAFVMGLKPSSYIFNKADSGRTHFGLISQDIEELLPQIGMTDMDFAGFIKSPKTEEYYEDVSEIVKDQETGEDKTVTRKQLKTRTVEGEYIYSLRYDEFIAPLICMVQKQQKQIEALAQRLSALQSKEEAK